MRIPKGSIGEQMRDWLEMTEQSGVSSTTQMVLCNNPKSTSRKVKKARQMGIPILNYSNWEKEVTTLYKKLKL